MSSVTALCRSGVGNDVRRPLVLDAVQLHDHAPLLPADVEVPASLSRPADHLPAGLGDAAFAALAGELVLTQRPHPTEKVGDDGRDQDPSSVPLHGQGLHAETLGRRQPLLHRHRQEQRGLLVRPCPQGGTYAGHLGPDARDAGRSEVFRPQPSGLTYVDARAPASTSTPRGTDTRMTSSVKCSSPSAMRADEPSRQPRLTRFEDRSPEPARAMGAVPCAPQWTGCARGAIDWPRT